MWHRTRLWHAIDTWRWRMAFSSIVFDRFSAQNCYPDLWCTGCNGVHMLDTSLPSELWNQIADPADVLCTACIDKRLQERGLVGVAEFYYVGKALVSRSYSDEHVEVLQGLVAFFTPLEQTNELPPGVHEVLARARKLLAEGLPQVLRP